MNITDSNEVSAWIGVQRDPAVLKDLDRCCTEQIDKLLHASGRPGTRNLLPSDPGGPKVRGDDAPGMPNSTEHQADINQGVIAARIANKPYDPKAHDDPPPSADVPAPAKGGKRPQKPRPDAKHPHDKGDGHGPHGKPDGKPNGKPRGKAGTPTPAAPTTPAPTDPPTAAS